MLRIVFRIRVDRLVKAILARAALELMILNLILIVLFIAVVMVEILWMLGTNNLRLVDLINAVIHGVDLDCTRAQLLLRDFEGWFRGDYVAEVFAIGVDRFEDLICKLLAAFWDMLWQDLLLKIDLNSSKFSLVSGLLAAKGDGALSVPEHSANEDSGGVASRRVDV